MFEKELNEIQKGCSLHERALIRMGFEAALKLALAQSAQGSPKLPSSNKIRKHFKKIGWEYCDDVTLENTLLAIKKLGNFVHSQTLCKAMDTLKRIRIVQPMYTVSK